jgi:signal transduction histidine kinase
MPTSGNTSANSPVDRPSAARSETLTFDQRPPSVRSRWQKIVPACLLVLLLVFGIGAYMIARSNLDRSQWVDHTYEVRLSLQHVQGLLYEAEASRALYLQTGSRDWWNQLQTSTAGLPQAVADIKQLTADNPKEQARVMELGPLVDRIAALLQLSPAPASASATAAETSSQVQADAEIGALESRISGVIRMMLDTEVGLLEIRQTDRRRAYGQIFLLVGLIFFATILLLAFYFRLLLDEIKMTHENEGLLRQSAGSYRVLSAKVLELQDQERRRVARELHDSVGQYLAVLRMNLGQMGAEANSNSEPLSLLPEAVELTDRAIGEVRTISYLLHPPMLDDVGLDGAVRWYAEGFAKRSGLEVKVDVPEMAERLPKEVELALFRTLQESLTNVHRHAAARTVEIRLRREGDDVTLVVKDDGKGLAPEALARFEAGLAGGVGLAGMRERVTELGGQFEVESSSRGTRLSARVPARVVATAQTAAFED